MNSSKNTDTRFFTNEEGYKLIDRFRDTISLAKYFDVLVGYFRISGFHQLYKNLEDVEKIRILVGLDIDKSSFELISDTRQQGVDFESNKKTIEIATAAFVEEFNSSEDSYNTEISGLKFKEFLLKDCDNKDEDIKNGGNGKKLEFRIYPSKTYTPRYIFLDIKTKWLKYLKDL